MIWSCLHRLRNRIHSIPGNIGTNPLFLYDNNILDRDRDLFHDSVVDGLLLNNDGSTLRRNKYDENFLKVRSDNNFLHIVEIGRGVLTPDDVCAKLDREAVRPLEHGDTVQLTALLTLSYFSAVETEQLLQFLHGFFGKVYEIYGWLKKGIQEA